jgi:hypothetical protein
MLFRWPVSDRMFTDPLLTSVVYSNWLTLVPFVDAWALEGNGHLGGAVTGAAVMPGARQGPLAGPYGMA